MDKESYEMAKLALKDFEPSIKPYRNNEEIDVHNHIPENGLDKQSIIKVLKNFNQLEEHRWKEGYVSGAVYNLDQEHIDFQNQAYSIHSQSNPLHFDVWPSTTKFEAEIVSMTANMMSAEKVEDEIVGVVSSGGTESILLAMKAYRDWAKETKGITEPEMICSDSAHVAFDKASHYFGIKMIRIPMADDFRMDVEAAKKAINKNTIVLVGSAPHFPHGIIDPIEELSEIAQKAGIGFHTDACLGGFLLPWAEKLGYDVPLFDFRLPGVTSMSVDTHKYGYAAKGTSVVLYRGVELRHYQYYVATNWPGGLYFSPTFAGSRSGALSVACWASMVSLGEDGYLKATKNILETAKFIKEEIAKIPELYVLGDPLFVVAFASDSLSIYSVQDFLSKRDWSLSGLHRPACVHISLTQRHTQPGLAQKLINDLKDAVQYAKDNPQEQGEMAPIYGLAGNVETRGMLDDVLKVLMDMIYMV